MPEHAKSDWRSRADETFLPGMPGRGRVALEMFMVVMLVFAASAFVVSTMTAIVVIGVELAFTMALVRPWSRVHGGLASRALAILVVVLAVVAPAAIERPEIGKARMLGVGVAAGAAEAGDPPVKGGVVAVEAVGSHTPADGVLHPGDRIVAIGGAPLDARDPTSDLSRRTHGDELPEDTTVTVIRDHQFRELAVRIPKVHAGRFAAGDALGRRIAAVRAMASRHLVVAAAGRGALVIALLLLLLRADGQSVATLGLVRPGALRELLAAIWMTAGTFAVQIAVAIPVGLLGYMLGILNRENARRTETLGAIAQQGSIVEFALAAIVAAAFEEIAFRGFLVPRMRSVVGSWVLAVGVVSVVFGLGHIYEGALATIQTACLGAWFAAMMLVRRRLVGPITAHAAFNTIMLIVIRLLTTTHALERLRSLAPH